LINKRLHIITTTAIKGVSDGGLARSYLSHNGLNIEFLLEKHDPSKDDSLQIMQFFDDPAPASQISQLLQFPLPEPRISTVVYIDPVSPFSIPDPVPTPTSTTYPAPTTATVVPSSSSRAKKSKQVSVRFAPQTVETERLREINLARRQQLAADLNFPSNRTTPCLRASRFIRGAPRCIPAR